MKTKTLVFVALIAAPLGFASEAPQERTGQICIILIPSYNNAAWRKAMKLEEIATDVLDAHPDKVAEYKAGKQEAFEYQALRPHLI